MTSASESKGPSLPTSGNVVARNFLTLGSSEFIGRAIAAGTTIYLARVLGVAAYGVLGFASALILYFSAVVNWGMELFGPREIAKHRFPVEQLVSSLLLARLMLSVVIGGGLALVALTFLPPPDSLVLAFFCLSLFPIALDTRWVHLGLERTGFIAVTRVVSEIIKIVLIFAFVHSAGDVALVPVIQFFGEMVGSLMLVVWLFKRGIRLKFKVEMVIVRRVYKDALPLMITSLLGLAIYNSDLIYLRIFRDRDEVGLYVAAYTLISFLVILGNTSRLSLVPTLTRLSGALDDQRELYHAAMARLFALGFPAALGGCLLAPQIMAFLFGEDYVAGAVALRILVWLVPLLLLRGVLQAVLVANGQQQKVLHMTGWSTVLNLGANLIFIPFLGMMGAALTTVATELLRLYLGQRYVLRSGLPNAGFQRYWRSMVSTAVMGVVLIYSGPASLWLAIAIGLGGYLLMLTLIGGIRFSRRGVPTLVV